MSKNSENIVEVIDDLKSENAQNTQAVKLLLNEINTKLEDIGDGKEFVYIRNTVSELKDSLNEKFNEFYQSINRLKESDDNTSQNDIIDLFSEKFKVISSNLENDLTSLTNKISALYDEFKLETGENFSMLKENLDRVSRAIAEENLEISEINMNYEKLSNNLISSILQTKNDFKSEINSKSEDITKSILKEFRNTGSNIEKQSEIDKKEIQNTVEKYFVQYCSKITEITDIVVNLKNELNLTSKDYKNAITEFDENLKLINNEFNSAHSALSTEFKDKFQEKFENLQNFISVNVNTLDSNIATIGENLKKGFNALGAEMHDKFSVMLGFLKENSELSKKYYSFYEAFSAKLDVLAETDYSIDFEHVLSANAYTQELIKILQAKVDELFKENSENDENMHFVNQHLHGLEEKALTISAELNASKNQEIYALSQDILSSAQNVQSVSKDIYAINQQIEEMIKDLDFNVRSIDISNVIPKFTEYFDKVENRLNFLIEEIKEKDSDDISELSNELSSQKKLLDELNAKLDVFVSSDNTELLEDELLEIKEIILAQEELFKNTDNYISGDTEDNFEEIISKIDNITKTISAHESNAEKIKENIIETIVSVFGNNGFTAESEDIKGFVEEKTDELNKQIHNVQSQLKTIKEGDITDCSYTLNDVEQDIANLRGAIKDVTSSTPVAEINQISRNIHNLTSSIDAISKNLTPAEIFQLKHGILKLNDDILSISSRTNKLLINSDETSKTVSDGVEAFNHIAYNLEERIKEFSNRELVVQIADKLERVLMLSENSATADATVQKVLMFLGEWVDAISETFEDINNKTDEISSVSDALSELKKITPEKTELFDKLEEAFEEQQSRLDRLEAKLNKLTETVELNGISPVLQKIDKLENFVETMNNNIEKLTSYVE